jgi:5'-nucleotidase
MISRRRFLASSLAAVASGAGLASIDESNLFNQSQFRAFAAPLVAPQTNETLLTILHTNDLHSQIDPLPANDLYAGRGGLARHATLVRRIRAENRNTLLVDAGDVFQGTPYFNLYRGEAEYRAMSAVGYDVVTLGNHDFDNGVEALATAMRAATFEFVSTNYDVRGTAIANRVRPYVVRELGGVRIGIFGLGIRLEGLNPPASFRGVTYLDPVQIARGAVRLLRERERCSMVICLSHLGYYPQPEAGDFGDTQLVAQVDGIDFIVSGHTHTFMERPVTARQPSGRDTVIFQVGKSGIFLGRVDFTVRDRQVTVHAGRLLDLPSTAA